MSRCGMNGVRVVLMRVIALCVLFAAAPFAGRASASDTIIFSDDFESTFTGWTVSGKASWYSGTPRIGSYAVKLPKRSGIQRTVSTLGWEDIKVSCWLAASLSRAGAAFQALWFDGATWALLEEFRTGDPDADGELHYFEFSLPAAAANNSRFAVRFRLDSKAPSDAGYVDNVVVSAGSRFLCGLALTGTGGSVKVNGVIHSLPWTGTFDYGATVVLQAVPDTGYHFTGWYGALTGSESPTTILVDGNKDITADFAVDTYRLAIGSGTGHGSVRVDGVQRSLPWVGTFERGASVMLEAVPGEGYHFTGWAGGLTGTTNPAFVTMEGDRSVSAGFASDSYVLHLSGSGGGGVNVNGAYRALPDTLTLASGSTVVLESAAESGWHFTGWSGDLSGAADPTSLVMDSDKAVTATFALDQYSLDLIGVGNGSVRVDGTDHGLPWSATFSHGDIVTLEAVPAADSHFTSWSGDLSGSTNPTVVVMEGARTIIAGFALNTYTLTIAGTNGTVRVNGAPKALPWSGPFAAGEVVNLEAVPIEGYGFASWSGDLAGSANPTAITMDGNRLIVAEFAVRSYTLTVLGVHGSLDVDGVAQALPYSASYDHGAVVCLEALPEVGYEFAGWSGDLSGTSNPVSLTMTGDKAIAANFSAGRCTLSISGVGGTLKANGVAHTLPWSSEYEYGTDVTLEAVPDACMRFSGWSGDLIGWDNPTSVAMDGNQTIAAEFSSIVLFTDVGCDFWAAREIASCVEADIVRGYPDGRYQPDLPVTRDQMAVYIARALAGGDALVPAGSGQSSFPDVPADHWALQYIEFAHAQEIVQGYPDGTYQPTIALDRAQMAVFIARAIATPTGEAGLGSYTPPPTPSFADVSDSFWAYKHVEFIAQPSIGVTHGYPDGLYHPEYVCTRDQMAVYVARAFELPM